MRIATVVLLLAAGLEPLQATQIRPALDANTKSGSTVVTYRTKMDFLVVDGPHDASVILRVFSGTRRELQQLVAESAPHCATLSSSVFQGWWSGRSLLTFGGHYQNWPFSAEAAESTWLFVFEVMPATSSHFAGYIGEQDVELKQESAEAYLNSGLEVRMVNPNPAILRVSDNRSNMMGPPVLKRASCAIPQNLLADPILIGASTPGKRPAALTADRPRIPAVSGRP
jgi:hypothetical protein